MALDLRKLHNTFRTLCHGLSFDAVLRFEPVLDMSTASIATRRNFDSFCLAILYNFPQLLFRDLEPGALLTYTLTMHQCHDWVISDDGSTVTRFDEGMPCDSTSVSSMFE